MKRLLPTILLTAGLACDPAGTGCQLSPLQRDLNLESLGQQAIEFYLPPGATPDLNTVVLDQLAESGADRLHGSVPVVSGSLGGPLEFVSSEDELAVDVTDIHFELIDGKILVEVSLAAAEKTLSLEVYTEGDLLRTCFIDVALPSRWLAVGLIVESDYSGKLRIRVEGEPLVSNGAVVTELELDCPEQPGSEIDQAVAEAVEVAYAQAAEQLTADLAGALTLALGLDNDLSASIGPMDGVESAHVMVHTGPFAEVSQEGTLRLGLTGGIEAEQAECIPDGAAVLPPGSEPGADFRNFAPVTGEPYSMGISISHGFLAQALAAAYRGGLLCRHPATGDLAGVNLDDLFESLDDFTDPTTVRAALWPGQAPELEFTNPVLENGEMLPRVILEFNQLSVDIYTTFEGSDVRLLGLTANTTMWLAPVLDGQNLYFWPAEIEIRDLEVGYSTMLVESANQLRSVVSQALERVLSAIVENTPPVAIPRPASAAGELAGAETVAGRLVLYFNP